MLSTSFEFRSLIAQNTKVEVKATLRLASGQTKYLVGDDFMSGEMSFSDAVSSAGSFDVGAAIINKLDFALNNYDRRFDDYDFTGATITPYIGVELSNGRIEWLQKGVYGVEQPETYGNTIGITALDNMRKLERPYDEVATRYPASLRTIVMDICSKCGVTLGNTNFANGDFVVQERPADDSLTCLAALAYAAQASGNWARFDNQGYLRLEWYNTAAFEGEDWLDGGTYSTTSKPYSDGDAADGGNFTDYSSGATVEGGEFGNNVYANVFAYSSAAIATDDVVVTGVRVTAQDKEQDEGDGLEGETAIYGSEGYVLEFPDNPLVQHGTASDVAERVGKRVVGMRFRPFDVSALGDPSAEAGDPIILTDRLQNQYRSYITTLTYKVGAYEAYACNAETPSRHSASSYSAATRAVVKLRNQIEREKTDRERAVENLAARLATSSGLYMTCQPQQDGSYIYYMHDKPTLAESQVVWKLTANAFGISTDGGKTYPYGLDVNGDAILNRIYAIGIDAGYINAGSIRVLEANGDVVLEVDAGTGNMVATKGTIGGLTLSADSLYNDSIRLDASGLTFRGSGQDIGYIAAQRYMVDGNLHGNLAIYAPSVFRVLSTFPYDSTDADRLVMQYDKASDVMAFYRATSFYQKVTAGAVEVSGSGNVYFGTTHMAYTYVNGTVFGISLTSDATGMALPFGAYYRSTGRLAITSPVVPSAVNFLNSSDGVAVSVAASSITGTAARGARVEVPGTGDFFAVTDGSTVRVAYVRNAIADSSTGASVYSADTFYVHSALRVTGAATFSSAAQFNGVLKLGGSAQIQDSSGAAAENARLFAVGIVDSSGKVRGYQQFQFKNGLLFHTSYTAIG